MSSPKVGFVSLGCPKALVDSERILTQLRTEGYQVTPEYNDADVVVVNTCGFIDSAKAESLEAIGEALAENGKVIVTGCMGVEESVIRNVHPSVLAVTGPRRMPALAQIPTLGELGFTAANLTSTFGFYAPASTPEDIQQRFHAEVNRLLQSAEMQERLRKLDNMAYPMSQQAFATLVRQDYVANAKVISEAGIQAQ